MTDKTYRSPSCPQAKRLPRFRAQGEDHHLAQCSDVSQFHSPQEPELIPEQLPILSPLLKLHPRPPNWSTHLHRSQPPPTRWLNQRNRPLLHPHFGRPPTRLLRPPHQVLPNR
jgi:hypothetical protein